MAGLIFAILYWNDEHSYDRWNPNRNNVFLLVNQMEKDVYWTSSSAPIGSNLIKKSSDVESYCYISGGYDNDIIQFEDQKSIDLLV